jgi:MerR family mercuric resistance operon transcriptional regulator
VLQLSRGLLAKKTGVNMETIRYYEKIGLMPDPPRTLGGHRTYDQLLLKRLSFIQRCRKLGFTINEIRELLELVDGDDYSCAEVLESTQAHIDRIRIKIKELRVMEETLKAISSQCSGKDVPECAIVEELWQEPS